MVRMNSSDKPLPVSPRRVGDFRVFCTFDIDFPGNIRIGWVMVNYFTCNNDRTDSYLINLRVIVNAYLAHPVRIPVRPAHIRRFEKHHLCVSSMMGWAVDCERKGYS